jgi:hypothetical protein
MTVGGIATVAAALALNLSGTVLLIGLMLIVAGGVKIAMIGIWSGFAGFGVPLNDAPASASDEGRR